MSNSKLIYDTNISPNKTSPRNHKIDTITIHCVVGQVSTERLGEIFEKTSRKASCNYGIAKDGKIVLIVDEGDRSWCSSNSSNDHRAITIEVASDTTHPYAVTKEAYEALIILCADICKRNQIALLKWKADKSLIGQVEEQNMTVHRWFANKACPGDYLFNLYGDIANRVNQILQGEEIIIPQVKVEEENNKLVLDGSFGKLTTTKLQKAMNTVQDGIVSNQSIYSKERHIACSPISWEWNTKSNGSSVIKAVQAYLNMQNNANLVCDGKCGNHTIRAMQQFLQINVDGILGKETVKALQEWLNSL